MALPRRCKKCSCYVAPHLSACPRCGQKSEIQAPVAKPTKEEKRAARDKADAKVPVVKAKHIHWKPSEYSLRVQTALLEELQRRLQKEESVRTRNAIRSEIRLVKLHLARSRSPSGMKVWSSEYLSTKVGNIAIFISPKKHRYVIAGKDEPADLIMESRKKHKGIPYVRLRRFEKSSYARLVKKEQKEAVVHTKRKKLKKAHRANKRLQRRKQS